MVIRKSFILFLSLLIAFFSCRLIYAMVSVAVTNPFVTGIVDIELKEYQKEGGEEVPWVDNPVILPGSVISKIPRISNDGNDCYIRAKITFQNTDDLDESNLLGLGDKWVKAADGYFYYTEILSHGAKVDLFEALSIPTDFPQKNEGKQFSIDIDVDAIQSENFTPQFNTTQPWGEIEILACGKEGTYEITAFEPVESQPFQIIYQGDANALITNSDSFFSNFPTFMPGDHYSESVSLENNSNDDIRLHFRSVPLDDSELLDKILLQISTVVDGTTEIFYEGPLRAAQLSEDSVLAELSSGDSAAFNFEIYVPAELNNQYTISASAVQWIFSTEITTVPTTPQTGDSANIGLYFGLLILSGGVLATLIVIPKLKKTTREVKHHDE